MSESSRAALDRVTPRWLQVALFVFWPLIACLLLFCVALVCAAAWFLIPFGVPTMDGKNSWTLKFPWSK